LKEEGLLKAIVLGWGASVIVLFCGVAVSAVLVFAEGASAASPADLDVSVSGFYYAYWRYYNGFS
jgi:hypothetical protein